MADVSGSHHLQIGLHNTQIKGVLAESLLERAQLGHAHPDTQFVHANLTGLYRSVGRE
jgi:hypothetical protein